MPDRFSAMVTDVAMKQAHSMSEAFDALCTKACINSAMAGALVARGVDPGTANMIVKQWDALGLFIPPGVYAPAHVMEATVLGTAPHVARQTAAAQPWLISYMAAAPGYERLAAQIQPTMIQPGMVQPGMVQPAWAHQTGPAAGIPAHW